MAFIPPVKIKVGEIYGKWAVLAILPKGKCLCRCECGTESEVFRSGLTTGHSFRCRQCGYAARDVSPEQRFWRCVDKNGPPHPTLGNCWVWLGKSRVREYGVLSIKHRSVRAHRFSWELHFGPIPEGMVVCHRCDRPNCCRPDHLFLGTEQDNKTDMVLKDRQAKGERQGASKLTLEEVQLIKSRYRLGSRTDGAVALGKEFGVSATAIKYIVTGRNWKHAI